MAARGHKGHREPDEPLPPVDEGKAAIEVAPGVTEVYERADLLKAYLGSLCGSVTDHARKLPRGVSTDLSKALALVVADDIRALTGKTVYQKVSRPKLDKPSTRAAEERAAYAVDLDLWKRVHVPKTLNLNELWTGEIEVTGGIKTQQLDIVLASPQDGLALGVDVKGLNTRENAGKNLMNRLGDFVSIAVNFHLRFPYAAIGGVLAVPCDTSETQLRKGIRIAEGLSGRMAPSEGPERLEAFALLVFDCETLDLSPDWPPTTSPVRYENFVKNLAAAYERRSWD